jgi:CheY-like chemotaxis protein
MAKGSKAPLHILLAEDNYVNQNVARLQLEKLGYRATIVNDGFAAFEVVTSQEVDLVLMDCQMPVLDGFEATRRIRQWEAAKRDSGEPCEPVHIIALTANAMHGDREMCVSAGMNGYLSKPVRTSELAAVLAAFADSASG